MSERFKKLKLNTLNSGAVEELFDEELKKVLSNIHDVNIEADAVREIVIKVKIKPSKDRRSAVTSVQSYSKLAPCVPHEGSLFLAFQDNKPEAFVNDVRQTTFPFTPQDKAAAPQAGQATESHLND